MRGLYHVHDNRPLVCNRRHEDGKPRVYRIAAARACPNGKHKQLCDGQALGVQCLEHWRELTDTERDTLASGALDLRASERSRVVAAAVLLAGNLRDPQPMYFDRTR